jgi:hypothetical protein
MTLILDRYQIDYRSEIVSPLMTLIRHGESACIVGLAGVGKSNLLHFLEQPVVRRHYLSPEADRIHFVSIPCWPGNQPKEDLYRAMLLWVWLMATDLNPDMANAPPAGVPPLQMLRSILRTVCYTHGQRVVFMFDEFESLIQYQPLSVFDDLRAIRDDHRATGDVVFVVITHHLPQLAQTQKPFKESKFYEMIRDHIIPLGPYQDRDAEGMIDAMLNKVEGATLDPADRGRLIRFSGGHSGLLRALFTETAPDFRVTGPRVSQLVASSERLRASCEHLWTHLHREEQDALRALLRHEFVDPNLLDFLCRRGLVVQAATPAIFSPLFQMYVSRFQLAG